MALQLGLRRGLTSPALAKYSQGSLGTTSSSVTRRWKSGDVGDVIGIDLGTTNSCVAIMVRCVKKDWILQSEADLLSMSKKSEALFISYIRFHCLGYLIFV